MIIKALKPKRHLRSLDQPGESLYLPAGTPDKALTEGRQKGRANRRSACKSKHVAFILLPKPDGGPGKNKLCGCQTGAFPWQPSAAQKPAALAAAPYK